MIDVKIIGMTLVLGRKPNKSGAVILAFFDCSFLGIHLYGCGLTLLKNGQQTVWPPLLESNGRYRKEVRIADAGLRDAILASSKRAYLKLTEGTDEEIAAEGERESDEGLQRFLGAGL